MRSLLKYKLEIFIVLLQLISPLGNIGVILGSTIIFYKVAFNRNLDLISLFILLLPSIAFKALPSSLDIDVNQQISGNWIKFYFSSVTNVFLVGPLAISTHLFAAFAVLVRLLINLKHLTNRVLMAFWIICLLISIYGIYLAMGMGLKSDGGLTVGIRIVLSVGAILFPFSIEKSAFEKQILVIVKMSLILFILGLLNNQWIFVTAAFPAFIIFSENKKIWKFLGLVSLIIMLYFSFTFTLKLTVLASFLLLMFYNEKKSDNFLFQTKLRKYLFFSFPILFMIFIAFYGGLIKIEKSNELIDRFIYKLIDDRGILWKYTFEFISNSDFFFVPAARNIIVYDYNVKGVGEWGVGAHNIYLEMARHLGLFATILLTIILGYYLLNSIKLIKPYIYLSKFFLALFASYLVFGLTGNSLVYDGVGFFFWLIIGQIFQQGYNINITNNHIENLNFVTNQKTTQQLTK